MRNLENRLLEKCLISYQIINLKLFHPEQGNFDQNYMRFLDTGEIFLFSIFEIWDHSFFNIANACNTPFSHWRFYTIGLFTVINTCVLYKETNCVQNKPKFNTKVFHQPLKNNSSVKNNELKGVLLKPSLFAALLIKLTLNFWLNIQFLPIQHNI